MENTTHKSRNTASSCKIQKNQTERNDIISHERHEHGVKYADRKAQN